MYLLMIRHGEIPSNVNKVYAGRSPEHLTERGVRQAKEVSEKLKGYKVDALYSSPIQRAIETARILGEKIGIRPEVNDAFREMEMGPWEGMSESDIAERYPEEWDCWNTSPDELKLPGRETLAELQQRVLDGVKDIHDKTGSRNVVVVTHVAVIRTMLLWHERKSLNLYKSIHVPNAEIFGIDLENCPSLHY